MEKKRKKQILVALSGGVDSSVAAVLLKKQGYKVTGLYLRLFKDEKKEKQIKRIAKAIGIPLVIKDVQKEFKKKVIDYFLREYKKGRTPNPCVVCNREIKFKFLFEELSKTKADFVATGHYARIFPYSFRPHPALRATLSHWERGKGEGKFAIPLLPSGEGAPMSIGADKGKFHLFAARDKTKDQSYFLYTLKQKQLAKILFPLGDYKKEEVKKIAKHLKLAVNEEESQSACFIAEKCPDEFLKKNIKMKPGNIIEINETKIERSHSPFVKGRVGEGFLPGIVRIKIPLSPPFTKGEFEGRRNIIGQHIGLPLYTIGQRRNIRIGGTGPYYVVGKDLKKNELLVVKNFNNPLLYEKELMIERANWLSDKPKFPLKARVCIRYHHPPINAIIKEAKNCLPRRQAGKLKAKSYLVKFSKPQRAVTPGQAAVIYSEKGEVLGGGVII